MRVCSTEFLGYAGFQVLHEVAFTGPELLLPRVALAPGLLLPRVALAFAVGAATVSVATCLVGALSNPQDGVPGPRIDSFSAVGAALKSGWCARWRELRQNSWLEQAALAVASVISGLIGTVTLSLLGCSVGLSVPMVMGAVLEGAIVGLLLANVVAPMLLTDGWIVPGDADTP